MKNKRVAKPGRNRLPLALTCVAASFAVLISISLALAAAPAGSLIRNQASATYLTDDGVERFATSNVVETVVRQAAAVELTQSQNKLAVAGGSVVFPHVVTNTGNGVDAFVLAPSQLGGDDYDFVSVVLYADADQNGVADNSTSITASPVLAAGESFAFVVVASVPGATPATQAAEVSIIATSDFEPTLNVSNLDRATITGGALIEVVKSMNVTGGDSPGGPFTVTLDYRNDGATLATDVTLIDALPTGMSYVAGSALWSVNGALALTDNDPLDVQGSAPDTIIYCAYDAGCTGLPESARDADSLSSNQVTAVLNQVAAGASGSLSFNVTIDSSVNASDLLNAAEFEYDDGGLTAARVQTNTVAFRVAQAASVIANGSIASSVDGTAEPVNVVSAFQGSTVSFENIIWNTGNDTDIIDVIVDSAGATFPSGTAFQLFRGDGATPLVDSSGNGLPDTGPLAPGTSFTVVLRASLPPAAVGNNSGAGYLVTKSARSTNDPSVSNDIIDSLDTIVPSSIDLTNDAAAGDVGALGEGVGPEVTALVDNVVLPGGTTRFTLYVANIGNTADELVLGVSTDSSFATETLPAGWSVNYRNEDDTANVTNTGTLLPGIAVRVYADVSVPADQASLVQSIYFRALSPTTGAVDILHDSVTVNDIASLQLEPSGAAQIEAGSTFIYSHRIANTSNQAIGPIALTTTDSLSADGWNSIIYEDSDNDGAYSAADAQFTSITSLAAGDAAVLFVKVFSPVTATSGAVDVTSLTASWNGGADSVVIENITTITAGDIAIIKEQAPDLGCNGTLDGAYTRQPFAVEPGNNCVRYRLVATNAGVEPVFNAIIADATPTYTVYNSAAVCSAPGCIITEPVVGGTGLVSGQVASVAPGESVEFTFSVQIE